VERNEIGLVMSVQKVALWIFFFLDKSLVLGRFELKVVVKEL